MGTYVYALNTRVRDISGQRVGVVEFRYKVGWSLDGIREEEQLHTRRCKRRIDYFDNHPSQVPDLMVYCDTNRPNHLIDGCAVFLLVGVCFSDGGKQTQVGTLRKVGRRWTIEYLENGQQLIADYKLMCAKRAQQRYDDQYA